MSNGSEVSLYVDAELKENSAHRYIRCTTCHSSEPHEIETPLSKLSLAAKCGACHSYEYELHLGSIHGQQLVQGNADVATCVDCHSSDKTPHSVVRVLEYGAPAFKKNIAETCGECHGDESLMARYGIVEKVYESYMRSFHGKAIQLASYDLRQLNKATCTSCHGTHDIQNPHDPDSPLAGMENLASTCEQCHEGAGAEFVKSVAMVPVPEPFDIVITSNSGYPLDLNLYQSVKGMSAAAQIVRPGGSIIMVAECWDGVPDHGEYGRLLQMASTPEELMEIIGAPGFSRQDQWQVQVQAQIQMRADVYVKSSCLDEETIRGAMLLPCTSVEETVETLLQRYGPDATICVLPEGPMTIPYVAH